MANRTYVRDAIGRFARTAGEAAGKAAKKAAREEAADLERVAKAKFKKEFSAAAAELTAARRAEAAQKATRSEIETDSDAVDYEVGRKKARDAVRKAQLRLEALRQQNTPKRF